MASLPRFTDKPLATRLYDEAAPRVLSRRRGYAYLKVGEGCDNPCTFCTIPQMRGRQRSRSIESLLAEARALEAQGISLGENLQRISVVGQFAPGGSPEI